MKIYYINNNSSKCIFNSSHIKLRTLTLPYLTMIGNSMFFRDPQARFIFGLAIFLALVAAVQAVYLEEKRNRADKLDKELQRYEKNKRIRAMRDEQYHDKYGYDSQLADINKIFSIIEEEE